MFNRFSEWLNGKPNPVTDHVITAKEVVLSPLSPSEFFKANHDEIHKGHITIDAFVQLQIGMLDQLAEELNK